MRRAADPGAPGPWYVEDGCCLLCGIPWTLAPELFSYAADHCFVVRQPRTPEEAASMRTVLRNVDLGCIRYRGRDPAVRAELEGIGLAELLDPLPTRRG